MKRILRGPFWRDLQHCGRSRSNQGSRVSAKNESAGFFAKNNPTLVSVEPTLAGQETGVDFFRRARGKETSVGFFSRSQPAWRQV